MQRMLCLTAWILVFGASASQAASVDAGFNRDGQAIGGENATFDFEIGPLRPVSDAELTLEFRGDYDTADELATLSLDGTVVGQAGTTMQGTFLGTNRVNHGPGDISFTQTIIISLADLIAAFEGNGVASLLIDRSGNVGSNPNARISGSLSFAAVPEPSTMVLTSLGLVCAGCYMLRKRASFKRSAAL